MGRGGPAEPFEGVAWLWQILGPSPSRPRAVVELLRLAATSADTPVRAETLNLVGHSPVRGGDLTTAHAFYQEALIAGRAGQNAASVARSLCGLARIAVGRGAFDLARTLQEEALELQRRLGQTAAAAGSLATLGWLTLESRGVRHAEVLHEESLTVRVTLGDPLALAYSLVHLGWLAHLTGRPEMARRHLSEALTTVRGCPDPLEGRGAAGAVGAAIARRDAVSSCDLSIDGAEAQERVPRQQHTHSSQGRDRPLVEAHGRLTPRALAVTWGGGDQADAAGLVEQALQAAEAHASRQRTAGDIAEPMLLTPRELEVASLIGRGPHQPRIAEILVIAERTAETHARNIREKLALPRVPRSPPGRQRGACLGASPEQNPALSHDDATPDCRAEGWPACHPG